MVPGYAYDVFISYRQKDNRADGWVTHFVRALRQELDALIKEDVSIYFDESPEDGLHELHDVDLSLRGKLNAFLFIPVISQTYCDPKSFAWNCEFLAFMKLAENDRNGLKVSLADGNVCSRILPVRIHELSNHDLRLLESILGPLRAVDFTYKLNGVNRPLMPADEAPGKPEFTYRNQMNKVAHAIKEILVSQREKTDQSTFTASHRPKDSGNSIAVLPFANMSNDPDQEYFSDGISEEIINMLVQNPNLKVPGRTSSFTFKNKNEDLRSIGEKLNVSHLLEGSVRKSGNRIRVTAQLIEAASGFHLWSQKYDRELTDIFTIQDEIAKAIVDQLKVTLSEKSSATERAHTTNVDAYQLYLKGMSLFYKRGLELFEALNCFNKALEIDSDYALAWVGVADTYSMLAFHGLLPPEKVWSHATKAAQRALSIAPNVAEVHSALGTLALLYERNLAKAEREYLKALELNPRYLQARCWYSLFYLQDIRQDGKSAIEHGRIAIENDPLSPYAHACFAIVLAINGQDGVTYARKAVDTDPSSFLSWWALGIALHWNGKHEEAVGPFLEALRISGRHTWAVNSLLHTYVDAGRKEEALQLYQELLLRSKVGFVLPSLLAMSSAAVGKSEEAIQLAIEAKERHDPFQIQTAKGWPDSKHLNALPAYREVLKSLGLD